MTKLQLRRFVALLAAATAMAIVLMTRVVFAQTGPAPIAVLTPTSVTIATLAFLVAFLVNAYNTGKFFGFATVPQAWLPYLGVGVPFLSALYASINAAGSITSVSLFNAIQSALFTLIASAGGASVHGAVTKHFGVAAITKAAIAAKRAQTSALAASSRQGEGS